MQTIKDYIAKIEGICGGGKDVIVTFKSEKKDATVTSILKRTAVKKSVSGYMFELEFQGVTFRLFSSGRAVFRGVKNEKELNRILAALLL